VLTDDILRRAPKSLLHDHLDGGLRPQTIIELAETVGYQGLPAQEADALGAWFRDSADSGSLERYLETFSQTLAVMQTVDGLHRVASECVMDLAADGVVYAEVRYAPELHLVNGLSLEDVVEAVNAGFRDGERKAAESGRRIRVTALLTAMRQAAKGTEIARLVVRYRTDGVVGFDIAGAEAGFPPTRHLDAFEYLRRENAHFTIHAGEAFGLPSIWEAIQWCGADRLGHGVRIIDDVRVAGTPRAEYVPLLGASGPVRRRPRRSRVIRARSAYPARDVPQQQRADRRGRIHCAASDLALETAQVPGHCQHRQPTDEWHVDDA